MRPHLWYIRGLTLLNDPELRTALRDVGRIQRWGPRAEIVLRRDPSEIHALTAGKLGLRDGAHDNLALLTPGDLFGTLDESVDNGGARARDDVEIVTLDRNVFEELTQDRLGQLTANLGVVRRRSFSVPTSSLLYSTPSARVASLMLHLVESNGSTADDRGQLDFMPRARTLAQLTGLADPTVSDIVEGLQRDRIVEVGRSQLVIPSLETMRKLAIR